MCPVKPVNPDGGGANALKMLPGEGRMPGCPSQCVPLVREDLYIGQLKNKKMCRESLHFGFYKSWVNSEDHVTKVKTVQ